MALVDLLIPGLLGPLPAGEGPRADRAPCLEGLLGRADGVPLEGMGTDSTLLALVGMPPERTGEAPLGALGLLGEGQDPQHACWLRADPLHLRADLTRLLVFDTGAFPLEPGEAAALVELFNAHFADRGLWLLAPHPGRWYLRLQDCPRIRTQPLEATAGCSPDELLPRGAEAGYWRALLNEVQMLFHSAPVNAEREARGLPSVNGLWLHGAGRLPLGSTPQADGFFGDYPLMAGLARLRGVPLRGLPSRAAQLLGEPGHSLALWPGLLAPVLAGDVSGWTCGLGRLEDWLTGLVDGLGRASGTQLRICPATGRAFLIDRRRLGRFWRRQRPFRWWLEHS